jgi:hypothetical protein
LPAQRYDTAYRETRQVSWDSYIEVRGNRYSAPADLAGQTVVVRISLDDQLQIYAGEQLVAAHTLHTGRKNWVTVPEHHATLWETTLGVQHRPLAVYEEATKWS